MQVERSAKEIMWRKCVKEQEQKKFQKSEAWGARSGHGAAARDTGRPRQAWGGRASTKFSARILFSFLGRFFFKLGQFRVNCNVL
jgi:hypothetical protein